MASRTAEKFREVQSKIDSYLFPLISHVSITRRLERIYNVLVQDGSTRDEPSHPLPQSTQLQESSVMAQDVLPHGNQEFTLAEIVAATNDFAWDTSIGFGGMGRVYWGRLHDGREVAVKWPSHSVEESQKELDILSRLRHRHIIRLLGSCMSVSKERRQLTTPQKEKKGILTISRQRKEPKELEVCFSFCKREEPEGLILVYDYMENGTLFDHLHSGQVGSSTLSRVTMSWTTRVDVLLGVSRAIEHLHNHANPPIIHGDIKSANILFDASWVPRLSDFGCSFVWDMVNEEKGMKPPVIAFTFGYMSPEISTGNRWPASDVYSLGVVMLEVLTGKKAFLHEGEVMLTDLASFAVPIIEADNIEELLDRRPIPEPTPWQLQVLNRVAHIARCCVKFYWNNRPAISDIVANLNMAHTLICRDEPSPVDESGLWPFLANVDKSDLEPEVLEEGR